MGTIIADAGESTGVVVGRTGYWVTPTSNGYRVTREQHDGTPADTQRVYARQGKATRCTCRGHDCQHKRAVETVLAGW